jgi:hypothetical protein
MLLRSAYLILVDGGADTKPFAASVAAVQNLPVATLEMLATEVVDVCTYRIDAWLSSIANERLEPAGGVYLGGFGWSEGLQPPGEAIPADGAVFEDPDSAGFLHLPSTQQAKSAAILYGGHLAHIEQGSGETLSLNLESDRVRLARWLIEGQRQGQSLSALLGYRFERSLVEAGDAQYVPQIRTAFPFSVGQTSTNGTEVAGANVVDGLTLHTRWKAGELGQVLSGAVLNIAAKHAPVLDNAIDALSDLLVAEGVHQAANGNPTRAAAAFDALAEGDTLHSDPDFIATPAAGQQVAHRVMVVLPDTPQPGWPGDQNRPRAIAEPRLNGWAGSILGLPATIRFRAGFSLANQDQLVIRDFTLADFDLCPLDVVYLASENAGDAPVVELIRYRLTQVGPDGQGAPFEKLHLFPERTDAQPEGTISLEEAVGLAWAIKHLLAGARALTAADLQLTSTAPAPGSIQGGALAELEGRVVAARQRIESLRAAYSMDPSLDNWWRASALTGPVDPKSDDGPAALLAALQSRIAAADAVSETDLGRAALARLAALLGKEFRVLPQVKPANGGAVEAAIANQDVLLESDATRPPRWLHDYGRVRPACEALDLLVTLSRALQRPARLTVGQLPVIPGQVWIGERLPADGTAPRLSLVAHMPAPVAFAGNVAGLMVDSWSEVVPTARVTTGLSFNYDEPKAQAPQTVLLAVPPDPARGWDFQSLEAALLETLELAKIRGVVAEELSDSDSPIGYLEFYRPALHLTGDQRPELEAAAQGA